VQLFHFALPLGSRHKVDEQVLLREGNRPEATALVEEQARLLDQAQYAGVQRSWFEVAAVLEHVATLEERLLAACQSWSEACMVTRGRLPSLMP
jgi:hypothetical protein